MKTILVLTDFTIRADHAAHYALKLAQKIKANLLLCNVYPTAPVKPVTTHTAWTSANYESFEEDSITDLSELAGRLNKQLDKISKDEFRPVIEQCSKAGSLTGAINEIVASRHVLMAVVAMHDANGIFAFLAGDHTSEVIEKADCPVLVLPYQAPFKGFKKIAFATDLVHNGMDVLHSLYGITKYFDSEILITHVAGDQFAEIEKENITKHFFTQDTVPIHYPKIYYKAIQNKSVTAGLDWLTENTDIDLMVLVHRKRNFFQKIFESSVTQKLVDHLTKPMLVFPCSNIRESLPVF